jgi:hypothetical protein
MENILKVEYIEENIKLTNNDSFIKNYSKEDEMKIASIREGEVLSKYMIIKSDHFPSCQRKFLNPSLLFFNKKKLKDHQILENSKISTFMELLFQLYKVLKTCKHYSNKELIFWVEKI